jgi:hypothetical protein
MSQTAQDAQRPVGSATGAPQPASSLTAGRASAAARPTGWIIASVVLGAATLMLLVWVAVLDSQNSGSQAATSAQLGTLNSRVGDLGTAVSQQQAQATTAADAASQRQATATAVLAAAATAAQARADVTHACLQDMLGIMGHVFDADDPQAALPTAASQLRQIEPACAGQ